MGLYAVGYRGRGYVAWRFRLGGICGGGAMAGYLDPEKFERMDIRCKTTSYTDQDTRIVGFRLDKTYYFWPSQVPHGRK